MNHPHLKKEVSKTAFGTKIVYTCASPGTIVFDRILEIDSFSYTELFTLVSLSEEKRQAFTKKDTLVLSQGYQSWSSAWELYKNDRIKKAWGISDLNIQPYRPYENQNGKIVHSHFLTYLRAQEQYIALVSPNKGIAPVTFKIDRKKQTIAVEIYSSGKIYANGDIVAELCIFEKEGYFPFKDTIKALFQPFHHFDKLSFLYDAEKPELPIGGYESWYNHYADINEKLILEDLHSIDSNDNLINQYYIQRGKPTIFQVDDGWESDLGDWTVNKERFPNGMKHIADSIREKNLIPGIWLAPFLVSRNSKMFAEHKDWLLYDESGKLVVAGWNPSWAKQYYCLDLSRKEVQSYLTDVFSTVINDWGFRYLKLDFLYAGLLPGKHAEGGAAFEWYNKVNALIGGMTKNKAGESVAFLGCGAPLESSFEVFPLMRIGADTKEAWDFPALKFLKHQGRPSAYINMKDTIGRSFMNNTIFVNDPDVVFMRIKNIELNRTEKELVALVNYMLASQVMFSDDTHDFEQSEEKAFTDYIVSLYDRLEGKEYGVTMLARDVYKIYSRDGSIQGLINLRNRQWTSPESLGFKVERAITNRFCVDQRSQSISFDRRSISLFEA